MDHKSIRARIESRDQLPGRGYAIRLKRVKRGRLLESRAVRFRRSMRLARWLLAGFVMALVLAPATAWAQIDVTPNFSITPSSSVTKWVIWMALGAIILAVLVLVGVGTSYLRFAPKFYGREEPPKRLPPGARPPLLARTARPVATVGVTRPSVPQTQARATTAVAERPALAERETPAPAPATETPAAEAASAAETTPDAEAAVEPVAEEATMPAPPTAAPSDEPAAQADAGAEAEAEAPEAAPADQPAEAAPAAQPAETAADQSAEAPPAAQPAAHGGASALDQETFDRVLEEQLAKGVDRRVAEGRARAAAVVAARKKAQA